MMQYVIGVLYRMGRRPKRGSRFYSKRLGILYGFKDAIKKMRK